MSRCRATSFYLAPGVLRYFKDHTVCARTPGTGELVELTHREHIRKFRDLHPGWDGVMLVGPAGGVGTMAARLEDDPGAVDLYLTSPRTIEGRRPEDAATYGAHQWASGGVEAAGGVRQMVDCLFPGAGRAVRSAAATLVGEGAMWPAQVMGAAWRAGLLDDPHMAARLLRGASPVAMLTLPDPMLEPLLAHLAWLRRSGVDVDVEAVLTGLGQGVRFLDAGAKRLLAENPSTPPGVLAALASDENSDVRQSAAVNPSTPPGVLATLASDEDRDVRWRVAGNLSAPSGALATLASDEDSYVRVWAAGNPSTPSGALATLASDEGWDVRWRVAGNPSTPSGALATLASDENSGMRIEVAGNLSAPSGALATLASDEDRDVRRMVAGNLSAPSGALTTLASDVNYVRQSAARNPSTPSGALTVLASDKDRDVRGQVAGNLSAPSGALATLASDEDWDVRRMVARNPSTPSGALTALASDENSDVRWRVAGNPSTPTALLAALASDEDWGVRLRVAENPSTPSNVFATLASDENSDVRKRVVGNPSTPSDTLAALASDEDRDVRGESAENPSTPSGVLATLASDENSTVRMRVARSPSTPSNVLATLASDESRYVRQTAAGNPSTPSDVLATLASDENRDVRQTAARNPNLPFAKIPQKTREEHRDITQSRQVLGGLPVTVKASQQIAAALLINPDTQKPVRTVSDLGADMQTRIVRGESAEVATKASGTRDGFTVTPLKTLGDLKETANHMGNCIAGYEQRVRDGRSILFNVTDTDTGDTFNVALERKTDAEGGPWSVGEINSRFNKGVDSGLRKRIAGLFATATRTRRWRGRAETLWR